MHYIKKKEETFEKEFRGLRYTSTIKLNMYEFAMIEDSNEYEIINSKRQIGCSQENGSGDYMDKKVEHHRNWCLGAVVIFLVFANSSAFTRYN